MNILKALDLNERTFSNSECRGRLWDTDFSDNAKRFYILSWLWHVTSKYGPLQRKQEKDSSSRYNIF